MSLEAALRAAVGASQVLVDPELRAPYETDFTGRFTGTARCVVRPAGTAEVAEVLRACAAEGAPVVIQGGNTGLVGGGVPAGGEVLLSLARLAELEPVDQAAGAVTAGAGVRLAGLQAHARTAGLDFGVDLAARSAATVGGLVATNAGGIHVLRHGSMRSQVTGVEAVLADGTVLTRLAGLAKDNTGYDLSQLLTGSEGTLAVLTRVRLRLVPLAAQLAVALVGVAGTKEALDLLAVARQRLPSLQAAEICYADGLALVREHNRLPAPFRELHPAYAVLECAGTSPAASAAGSASAGTDPMDELLEALADAPAVLDATVAADSAGRARLWAYRESLTEAVNAAGVPVKLDVCVPPGALPGVVAALPETVAGVEPAARTIVWGHLNEANLHINVLGAQQRAEQVTEAVLRLVAANEGSISSEHGVGRAKARWLPLSRSPAEIAAMRRIKQALDPAGLLNPGVLLPA
ncbi:MAG: FAD-binding oxidoreductase [Micromonosporaceae bacterium]|nr:FAD-binding oxidoreductase [Micromonosporaceae bacterium]